MKTVRELAEEIGVSKVAINKRIETLGLKNLTEKSGNKTLIPENVEKALKTAFNYDECKQNETNHEENINNHQTNDNTMQTLIDVLREQLAEKDEQIRTLQTIIDQEQKLRMVTEQKLLETKQEDSKGKKADKQGIFNRFFNHKQSETKTTDTEDTKEDTKQ